MRNVLQLLVVLGVLTASLFASSIKVGSLAAITGPVSDLVAPVVRARTTAAKLINDQGGLHDNKKFQLVSYDSRCDGRSAVDAGKKAVNIDRVVAIVGATCSGASVALAQSVTIPAGIVQLSDTATAPSYTDLRDEDLAYRVAPSDSYQGVALAKAILDDGVSEVAVTYANDDYNIGIAKVFIKAFEYNGGTVKAQQLHEPKKASYRSELSTLRKSRAEALIVFSYYGGGGLTIIRNSLENNFFDKFYGAESLVENRMLTQIGYKNIEGKFKATRVTTDNDSKAFRIFDGLALSYGIKDSKATFVANGFDAVFAMGLAIEKAGSADRNKIKAALRAIASPPGVKIYPGQWKKAKELIAAGKEINYEGASGNMNFDENGDVSGIYEFVEPSETTFKRLKLLN